MSGNEFLSDFSKVRVICRWWFVMIYIMSWRTNHYSEAVATYERTSLSDWASFFMISARISLSILFMSSAVGFGGWDYCTSVLSLWYFCLIDFFISWYLSTPDLIRRNSSWLILLSVRALKTMSFIVFSFARQSDTVISCLLTYLVIIFAQAPEMTLTTAQKPPRAPKLTATGSPTPVIPVARPLALRATDKVPLAVDTFKKRLLARSYFLWIFFRALSYLSR